MSNEIGSAQGVTASPSSHEDGRPVQYACTTSQEAPVRGVLLHSARSEPAVYFRELLSTHEASLPLLNGVVWWVKKAWTRSQRDRIAGDLLVSFRQAFPDKSSPHVNVFQGEQDDHKTGSYIEVVTPADNVRASDIIVASLVHKWKAASQALVGPPWYVGLQTVELLQQIRFENIPEDCKEEFVMDLHQYLKDDLDSKNVIKVVDIWEEQEKSQREWLFNGSIWALVCVGTRQYCTKDLNANDHLQEIVQEWPRWYHWKGEYLIELSYPGRFPRCTVCKHTAQDQHRDEECTRIICGLCGHAGHDATAVSDRGVCEAARRRHRTAGASTPLNATRPSTRPRRSIKLEDSPSP